MQLNRFDSLTDAIHRLASQGYTKEYNFRTGLLRHEPTGKSYRPDEIEIVEIHRFNGRSNPSDLTVLFVIQCKDDNKGIVMAADGLYAQLDLLLFMDQAQVRVKEELAFA